MLIALVLALSMKHELDLLMLPDAKTRRASACPPEQDAPLRSLAVAAALTSTGSRAFAGLLGFVRTIVPHIMRRLVGDGSRLLLPGCARAGPLCSSYATSRLAYAVQFPELPVGIALSFIGGPFFVWLLLQESRKGAQA